MESEEVIVVEWGTGDREGDSCGIQFVKRVTMGEWYSGIIRLAH